MPKFVVFNGGYWKIDGCIITNPMGGYCFLSLVPKEDVAKAIEANGFFDLPALKNDSTEDFNPVYNKTSKYGWINPLGEFFPCEYACHAMQAEQIHHSTETELEMHWVKIYKSVIFQLPDFMLPNSLRISTQQIATLVGLGYKEYYISAMQGGLSYLTVSNSRKHELG